MGTLKSRTPRTVLDSGWDITLLPALSTFQKKKQPIPIRITGKDLPAQVSLWLNPLLSSANNPNKLVHPVMHLCIVGIIVTHLQTCNHASQSHNPLIVFHT